MIELFEKLIGVKQGRLTWPFDSKPGAAKNFFEPLLEVEVFRQCFERLKPAVDQFTATRTDHEKTSAGLHERIRDRADVEEKMAAANADVDRLTAEVDGLRQAMSAALEARNAQIALKDAVTAAVTTHEKSRIAAANATSSRADAETRAAEAEAAQAVVARCVDGHTAFEAADRELKALEDRRKRRDELRSQREDADKTRVGQLGKISGLRDQESLLAHQQQNKTTARDEAVGQAAQSQQELESSLSDYERARRDADEAATANANVNAALAQMTEGVAKLGVLALTIDTVGAELASWDPAKLEQAKEDERLAVEVETAIGARLASAEGRRSSLSEQLNQIAGGMCPFLKEACRQFDPGKVQQDLSTLDADVEAGRLKCETATVASREAKAAYRRLMKLDAELVEKQKRMTREMEEYLYTRSRLLPASTATAMSHLRAWNPSVAEAPMLSVLDPNDLTPASICEAQADVERFGCEIGDWWAAARVIIDAGLQAAESARKARTEKDAAHRHITERALAIGLEIDSLLASARLKAEERAKLEAEVVLLQQRIANLDAQLDLDANLDSVIDSQREITDSNRANHQDYLGAKSLADQRENLQARAFELRKTEGDLDAACRECDANVARAREAFDAAKFEAAEREYDERVADTARVKANLQHVKQERANQDVRLSEWKAAVAELGGVLQQIDRCNAAIDLTELARRTLRDAAPDVAQHLCNRIASRAQALFNQINTDPIELAWSAERYSLEVTPGGRRFAMLSGGEQTKLALAMTLAMVEEFSGLRLCAFDEPTYGVDADSRRKLADAILQVQEAAKLDQLLLVSHDDAFEGKIEHTVLLKKSAAGGTEVTA